jgi:hypothetical protein
MCSDQCGFLDYEKASHEHLAASLGRLTRG